jgi:hypothetical protein
MKRVILVIAGLILSFAFGYWTKGLLDFGEAMGQDHFRRYTLNTEKTDSSLRAVLNNKSRENFDDFLFKFMDDSLFQFDRIKFPLKSVDLEKPDKKFKEKKDWKFTNLFADNEYKVQTYDNFEAKLRDTDERMIAWEGVGNGINIQFNFRRTDGLWYLIEYNDYSD